jgi:hypothetical protein
MPRRSKRNVPENLRDRLVDLLTNFESALQSEDLREKVIALVPAYHLLRDLGSSLTPEEAGKAARDRMLFYLRKYPYVIIDGNELMVVAGINEWPRRIRELRKELGWKIISGSVAKEMAEEEEFPLSDVDVTRMKPDDYILVDENQDRDAAFRWKMANGIRRKKTSIRDKILEYLLQNVGKQVSGEELRYLANDKTEWARRVRELRTELGWQIVTKTTGMPDLPVGVYVLASEGQGPEHDRTIPDPVRREVLQRDDYKCRHCSWHHEKWNPSDPRHLEPHHVKEHVKGGENKAENLITLCNICHDKVHRK